MINVQKEICARSKMIAKSESFFFSVDARREKKIGKQREVSEAGGKIKTAKKTCELPYFT